MKARTHRRAAAGLLGVALVLLVVAAAFGAPAAAHGGDDGLHHHDGWMGTHSGTGGWMVGGLGFLWTVGLLGAVVVGYLLLGRRGAASGTTDGALDLLRRRYAQGEIDEEEFEARRERLLAGWD